MDARSKVKDVWEQAAKSTKSARLSKVLAKLQAENPFDTVLDEIDKMLELIKEEAKADKENFDWCVKKRDENNDELDMKTREILSLEKEVDRLDKLINDPETGLKRQMSFPEVTRKATRVWSHS